MTTISTDISFHNVRAIKAAAVFHAIGRPVRLMLESHTGLPSYINIFISDAGLASRLADAINAAAAPPIEEPDMEFAAAVKASIEYFNRYARDERR